MKIPLVEYGITRPNRWKIKARSNRIVISLLQQLNHLEKIRPCQETPALASIIKSEHQTFNPTSDHNKIRQEAMMQTQPPSMMPTPFSRRCRPSIRTGVISLLILLLSPSLLLHWLAVPSVALAQPIERGAISGSITGTEPGTDFSEVRVVLLKYKMDAEGKTKADQVGMIPVNGKGEYAFEDIIMDPKAVYQLGTRFKGQMMGSKTFAFPKGENRMVMNLAIPKLSQDNSQIRVKESILIAEPRRGVLWVTEVLYVLNASQNIVDTTSNPMEVILPRGAKELNILRNDLQNGEHKRAGNKLLVYGHLQPAINTLAFRYSLPAPLGTINLVKHYPYPTDVLRLLSPQGQLVLSGDALTEKGTQTLQEDVFDAWEATMLDPGVPLVVSISGVPANQYFFLFPLLGFVVVMAGLLIWFFRKRLSVEGTA